MTLQQFHTYQEQTFDSYMNKLIKNEGKDAKKEISRRAKREIPMSQLSKSEYAHIAITDTYDLDHMTFSVKDDTIIIKDAFLGQALAALPPNRREVILLSYFMAKSDPQIGALLNLTSNAIRYRKMTALQRLRELMETLENER